MNNSIVRTMKLSGEDALYFAESIFRPTLEEVRDRKYRLERLNEEINITRRSNGYEAEISDLDLSFLDAVVDIGESIEMDAMYKTDNIRYDRFGDVYSFDFSHNDDIIHAA